MQAAHDKMSKAMLDVDTRSFNSVKEKYKEEGRSQSLKLRPLILNPRYAKKITRSEKSKAFHVYNHMKN